MVPQDAADAEQEVGQPPPPPCRASFFAKIAARSIHVAESLPRDSHF